MFTKDELKQIRIVFWDGFGSLMQKERSLTGKRKNWTNYKSNIKGVYFRMDVTDKEAFLAIDIQIKDNGVRDIVWEQFSETHLLLKNCIGNEMELLPSYSLTEYCEVHRMKWSLPDVSLFNKQQHEEIYEFLRLKIKGLDEYWSDFYHLFDALCH